MDAVGNGACKSTELGNMKKSLKRQFEDIKDFILDRIILNPRVAFLIALAALVISIVKLVMRRVP